MKQNVLRVGVDIGGTFTDIVAVDPTTDAHTILKVPSTSDDPIRGTELGLATLFNHDGWRPDRVEVFIHGTTIATNTIIERTGARTGLITTFGFRDVLEVGRTERPPADVYNLWMDRPEPLVPRRWRIGVRERITARGDVETPLAEADVRAAVARLVEAGVEAVAVCFLNGYRNGVHERRVRELIEEIAPQLYVALSSETNPQYREYERCSTTVLSAYVGPRISGYIGRLTAMLERLGLDVPVNVMQASGGLMTPDYVKRHAVRTMLSGPAGGVLGALAVGRGVGEDRFVTLDMGGTSADVAVVENGRVELVEEHREEGLLVRVPMLDIATIGAGGGSIAWIDSGGVLKVGPQSAGADPGPACYGKGGTQATVTDANVVLGYIDPDYYLGGSLSLDRERAVAAVSRIADALSIPLEEAAFGIVRVANANMVRAIKRMTTLRGRDPRDFSLLSFGGAGALHAASLLRELGMRQVVVPLNPGVLSACGLVAADIEYQFTASVLERLDALDEGSIEARFGELEEVGRTEMASGGVDPGRIEFRRAAKLRYRKQRRDLRVEVRADARDLKHELVSQFGEEHERRYGYAPSEPVEVIELQLAAVSSPEQKIVFEESPPNASTPPKGSRSIFVDGLGRVEAPVFSRSTIALGTVVEGPAVIEQYETNLVVLPRQEVRPHASGVLLLREGKDGNEAR